MQPWVTSLDHRAVLLRPEPRLLLPQLDGNTDRVALMAMLEAAAPADDPDGTGPGDAGEARLTALLRILETNCLLEPEYER